MSEIHAYFFAILTIGSLLHLLLETILNPTPGRRDKRPDKNRRLSPTEVAFLSKEGDVTFALVVVLFDMMHREVKDKITGGEIEVDDHQQKSYEIALRKAAGGSLKQWSLRKIEGVAGMAGEVHKDPIKLVTKLPVVYKVIRGGVEGVVQEVFRDPRNIKKLVSVPGLMRMAAEVGASGARTTLAEQLKEELTDAGFLASDEVRHRTVKTLTIAFGLCQFSLLALVLLTVPSVFHGLIIYFGGLSSALIVHACTALREFIPLYSDLARALAQVKGTNIRITVVRGVLKAVGIILNVLSAVVFILLLVIGSFFLGLTNTHLSVTGWLMLFAQMVVHYIALSYLLEAYKLKVGEMPTRAARRRLAKLKKKYDHDQTLPALKALLGENTYNQDLSYLIALYGLEALLLI